MKIRDLMTKNVECLGPRSTLKKAAQLMIDADVGGTPVVEEGRVIGVLTDRDIVMRTVAEGINPEDATVGEVMSPRVIRCGEDDDAEEAARIMAAHDVRRVVVTDDRGGVAGIVALADLAAAAPRLWRAFGETVERGAEKRFGETALLKALKAGEELEIRGYHQALNDERLPPELKDVICDTLLPMTWSHVSAIERCLHPEPFPR